MSDLRRAILGLSVGQEFEPGQHIFALGDAIPLPGWPSDLPSEVLDPLINAADLCTNSKFFVTEDYAIHLVDEATTRVMKSAVCDFIPRAMADVFDALVDDQDHIRRWHRSEIVEANAYRFEYKTRGLWGEKILPVYYYAIRDVNDYWYLFLQQNSRHVDQIAEKMGRQLLALSGQDG